MSFHITLIGSKPLRINFHKIDELIRIFDGTKCLILFGSEIYAPIYNRITYLISLKSGITFIFSDYFSEISKLFICRKKINFA